MNRQNYIISMIWGKSNEYAPAANEPFVWDGELTVANGTVTYLDQLHYKFYMWTQGQEVPERLFDLTWHALVKPEGPDLVWKSSVPPCDPAGLEGIRFQVQGTPDTILTIAMAPIKIQITLGELLEREHLRYHVGGKFSGVPVEVFLGPDARPRVSRKTFLNELNRCHGSGWLVLPDEWEDVTGYYDHSMYGALLTPGQMTRSVFPVEQYVPGRQGECLVKLQLMALLNPAILPA